jgi:hypothetical protein
MIEAGMIVLVATRKNNCSVRAIPWYMVLYINGLSDAFLYFDFWSFKCTSTGLDTVRDDIER